ncbi:SLC13 family permease [Mitsuokella multacida]|uniref:Citrate transporter n=1 Tax=Mitsuokella multacida TaxID=52226 RepID=A0A414NVG2_9FIRM|nr:SLC13 family permease [Mitsuokella multacida]RHF50961.1 citrate transporter [Mitsuokella multacida]
MEMAQILMVITLIFMVWGKTPLYLTAIVGSTIAALAAGFPISGKAEITLAKLINGGLNPVIADITGVLMFVGILETSGFLKVIINKIISWGSKLGGAPGITAAGSLAAGCIGALTGFTQPVVTAAITGPVATKLGMNPNKTAGLAAHAGHFGNFAGFTHPTQVAVVATAAIGFGAINVVGAITGISIIAFSWYRIVREMRKNPPIISQDVKDEVAKSLSNKSGISFSLAIFPFLLFCIGFVFGIPVFVDGTVCAILVAILAKMNPSKSETDMINGVKRASIPIVATISFLFMSGVINKIGLVDVISNIMAPLVSISPVYTMLFVSALAGFITQSNAASVAIDVPFLQVVLAAGADPLTAACAAAGGSAVTQYYLTGGPVAALSTVIPVVKGSNLKDANKFQRPAMLFGLLVLFLLVSLLLVIR